MARFDAFDRCLSWEKLSYAADGLAFATLEN